MSRPAALVDTSWIDQAVRVIEQIARRQPTVTAEDLRREHEPPEHQNQIGGAFKSAYAQKIVTPVGYRPSRDKSRRGGAVRVWALHPSQEEKEK